MCVRVRVCLCYGVGEVCGGYLYYDRRVEQQMNNASSNIKDIDGGRFEWRVGGNVDYHSCQLLRQ